MRDERLAPKGWPVGQRARRSGKVSKWHDDWEERHEKGVGFQPEGRKDGSDYNLHYVDLEAPSGAMDDFSRRVQEIDGRDPVMRWPLPVPDAGGRFRGALLGAVGGDALARARVTGTGHHFPWKPALHYRTRFRPLTEFRFSEPVMSSSVIQMLAFTVEGLIRANAARRLNPADNNPLPEVQHAYQRWLYTQHVPHGASGEWHRYGGPFARAPEPDGWLVRRGELFAQVSVSPNVLAVLEDFARTGVPAYEVGAGANARGGSAVPRSAAAAVWSGDIAEVFHAASDLARLTHNHPDDYLPAGTMAAILHQQIRDVPFSDCLGNARQVLERYPAAERTAHMIDEALRLNREVDSPATPEQVGEVFPSGGQDGAEALALGLYCALASDYVREAVLLSANYAGYPSVVGSISGILIGAECGADAIPRDLGAAGSLAPVLDELVTDALNEFSPHAPTDPSWLERYPAW